MNFSFKNFQSTHPLIAQMLSYIFKVVGAIGIFTIIKMALYFNIGQDYETITVKYYTDETEILSVLKDGYDIFREFDLDPENKFPEHRKFVIGPQDKRMTKISLYISTGEFKSSGVPIYKLVQKDFELSPQVYLLVRAPVTENIPASKMTFETDYKKGELLFTSNLRSGINDRTALEVQRTIFSFLAD